MNTVKLIVYGTLMSGERNHRFCRNAVSINPCTITGTLYDTGYGFPAFVPEGDSVVKAVSGCRYYRLEGVKHTTGLAGDFDSMLKFLKYSNASDWNMFGKLRVATPSE